MRRLSPRRDPEPLRLHPFTRVASRLLTMSTSVSEDNPSEAVTEAEAGAEIETEASEILHEPDFCLESIL